MTAAELTARADRVKAIAESVHGSVIGRSGNTMTIEFPADVAPGIVAAWGMGGFVLPILFGVLMDITGIRSSAFMLMYGVVWVSLIWMYWTEVRRTELMGSNAPAFSLQG